jgi:hypothetical protein
MVGEGRELLKVHAYAGDRKVAPTIVSTNIERIATAMRLNL